MLEERIDDLIVPRREVKNSVPMIVAGVFCIQVWAIQDVYSRSLLLSQNGEPKMVLPKKLKRDLPFLGCFCFDCLALTFTPTTCLGWDGNWKLGAQLHIHVSCF